MEIVVSIPDGFVPAFTNDADLARQMLESYAIENYRKEAISLGRLAEILDLSIDEANALLKSRNVVREFDAVDIAGDRVNMERFLNK